MSMAKTYNVVRLFAEGVLTCDDFRLNENAQLRAVRRVWAPLDCVSGAHASPPLTNRLHRLC